MKTLTRITSGPAVMSGKPCLRGLRVTGGTIVGLVAAGHSRQEGKEAEPMGSVSLRRSPMARRLVLALLLAVATVARASTPLTITMHPGARQTFQGFGASLAESPGPYGRISQADRDTLARLVWQDCRFRILRLWFSPPAFAPHPGERDSAEFLRDYVTSGMTADAQRAGASTLLLAPNQVPAYLGKGDVITSQGITDYANLLADFIRKVKDENGITFAASGVLNEPHDGHPIIQANQWAEMVRGFRKALDERGLQLVAIIAPEHASGGDAYCMQSLESIRRDTEAWRALGGAASHSYNMGVTERMAALAGDKPFWMTEAAANGPEEPGDALAAASLAARVLNDLNHRTTDWIHFIAYHLADPADDQTRMIRYWTTPFRYEILQKYSYYQQLSQTFDVGAVFRHSTSSLGDPEMTWTYGKKPKLVAAAARNADGTWAVGLANFTHTSCADRRDNEDQHGFPAETFDVTVVIDELRAAGDLIMQVNRSNHGINNRPAGTVTLRHGCVTLRDVAPCDLITLRASRSRGVEELLHEGALSTPTC